MHKSFNLSKLFLWIKARPPKQHYKNRFVLLRRNIYHCIFYVNNYDCSIQRVSLLRCYTEGYDDLGLVTERIVETDASPSATEEVLQPTVVAAEKAAPAVVVEAATVPAEAPAEDDSAAKPATEPGPIEPEPAAEEEMPDLGDFFSPYSNSFFYFRLFRISFVVTLRS